MALRIETGRWSGLKREERSCRQCTVEEVEDEEHFLLRCEGWRQRREMLAGFMDDLVGEFCTATDDRNSKVHGTDPGSSLQQWESREFEGRREDMAAQIPAECL